MSTTYTLPHAPTFQLTILDDADDAHPEPGRYYRYPGTRDAATAGREKAHKAAARLVKAKPRKSAPKLTMPNPDGFPKLAGFNDALAYELLMGHPWADPGPRASDFGGPDYPPYPHVERPYYRPTRAEKKRADKLEGQKRDEWNALYDAYRAAMDAWKDSDGHVRLFEEKQRWYARQEQFSYNPRKRNAKAIMAKAVVARG